MAKFQALDELLDDSLTLPVRYRDGEVREVRIPAPSAQAGVVAQKVLSLAVQAAAGGKDLDTEFLSDAEEADVIKICLGPLYDELLRDLDLPWFRHVGITAFRWVTMGLEAAEAYWTAAGDPSRMAPNREARRKQTKKNGSASASKTPRRGSTSGTSGRKAGSTARQAAKT